MSDIVDRLKMYVDEVDMDRASLGLKAAVSEAANEIERLRAALREIVEVDSGNDVEMDAYNMHRIAKEALGDE